MAASGVGYERTSPDDGDDGSAGADGDGAGLQEQEQQEYCVSYTESYPTEK